MRWETQTYDGPGGWYNSSAIAAVGATLTLAAPIACARPLSEGCLYPGVIVAIMRGPGQGQWRRLASVDAANVITLESAFEPQPQLGNASDAGASFISVTVNHGQAVFEGNSYVNGTTWQTYGAALETVIAGNVFREMFTTESMNTTAVAAGLRLFGHRYVGGYQPNWWSLVVGNTIDCTTEFRVYADDIAGVVFSWATVVRDNAVTAATLALNFAHDVVVEHNSFAAGFCAYAGAVLPTGGVAANASSSGVVIR